MSLSQPNITHNASPVCKGLSFHLLSHVRPMKGEQCLVLFRNGITGVAVADESFYGGFRVPKSYGEIAYGSASIDDTWSTPFAFAYLDRNEMAQLANELANVETHYSMALEMDRKQHAEA